MVLSILENFQHVLICVAFTGGLYSGEVVVWDTSRTQDPILAQTGMSPDTHREPVYQVLPLNNPS